MTIGTEQASGADAVQIIVMLGSQAKTRLTLQRSLVNATRASVSFRNRARARTGSWIERCTVGMPEGARSGWTGQASHSRREG